MRDERRVPTEIPTEKLSVDDTSVGKGSDVEVLTTQIDAGTKEIIPFNPQSWPALKKDLEFS